MLCWDTFSLAFSQQLVQDSYKATLAKTAFLSSLKPRAPVRATPYPMSVVVIMVAAADSGVDKLNWLAVFKESTAWEKMNGTHVLTTFAKWFILVQTECHGIP